MNKSRKIAIILSAALLIQPSLFAVDSELNKEIVALELELVKMNTKVGEYADWSEAKLEKKKAKTKKLLEEKKKKAKKEAEKDGKRIKEGAKKTGESLKDAGTEIGHTFRDIFSKD